MGFLSKLFGGGSAASTVAESAVKTAEGVADIVERWKPSEAARHQMSMDLHKLVNDSLASARSYDPRSSGGGLAGEIFNVFVDGLSRLIRPGVTIILIGGVFGWWQLPPPRSIDPVYMEWTYTVVAFWFGSRTIFKDIPSLLAHIKGK